MNRFCSFCGKVTECDCHYSDFGLVKLDNTGKGYTFFDACPECLQKVVNTIDSLKKKS